MFSLLISKVVITTLTFLRNTESIYLFVGNLKTVQFVIFIFNVIPFGLSPVPYVFTKVMRQLTKYWRQKGIRFVLYIDDGLGGAGTFNRALTVCQQVKSDLISCGFTPNQKSVWIPTQELIWLGHVLNFREATITVTREKILKLKQRFHLLFPSKSSKPKN